MWRIVLRGPLPPVPEIAQPQVVSDSRTKVAGEPDHHQFTKLRPWSFRRVLSGRIAKKTAHINLIGRNIQQLERAEGTKEAVLRIEVVVKPPNIIVGSQWRPDRREIPQRVDAVTDGRTERAIWIRAQRHRVPNSLDGRADSQASWIQGGCRQGHSCAAVDGCHWIGIQGVCYTAYLDHSRSHRNRWNLLFKYASARNPNSLIPEEQIGLAAQYLLRNDRAPNPKTKPTALLHYNHR